MKVPTRASSPPAKLGYPLAVAITGAAVALRWALSAWIGDELPLVTLFGAVALTVWVAGYRPATVTAGLGYLACYLLFIRPVVGSSSLRVADAIGFLAYLLSCAVIIGFGEALQRSRAQVRERRELLRITLASIGDAVITTDTRGRVAYVNAVAESLTGWASADAAGRLLEEVFRIVDEDTREPVESPAARALREGSAVGLANHTVLIARDGSECPIDDSAAPIRDEEGAVAGCVLIFRDVTERRRAERAQARLASIVTASPDAIVSKTLEGVILSWNAGAERVFGYSAAEAVGRSIELIVPQDLRDEEHSILQRLRRGERIEHFETVRVTKDGRRIDISLSVSPVLDADGRVIGASKVARDVTESKRAAKELERLAKELRLVTDAVPALIAYVDSGGHYRFNNKAYEDWFGRERHTWTGLHMRDALGEAAYERIRPHLEAALSGQRVQYEDEVPYKDGGQRFISAQYVPDSRPDGSVAGCFVFVTDMTERHRAESARRQFFTLAESSGEFVGMYDLELRPFYVNAAGLRMVGLASLEEAQRTSVLDYFHPDERKRIRDEFLPRVSRDGRGEIETRFRHFRTGETLWVIYSVVTLTDDRGHPTGFGTVTRDITDRKRGEEALRDADRRKDVFLATLAHELRNPLAPLGNMLEVLKRADDSPETRRQARETMERQLGQLVRLVDDLLDVSRITRGRLELRRERVVLGEVIDQALETSRPLIEHFRHELVVNAPADVILLDGDPVRLAQVFGNLLNNSCKYTPAGGRIELSFERHGDEAVVTVKDDGIGMAPDLLARIFEMFAQGSGSIERSQGGLGIGLTLTRQLVEMHGGSVTASSAGLERGSEFRVRLPALPASEVPRPAAPVRRRAVTPRRVLVVDDNRDSAESLMLLLSMSGHATSVAHDGLEAIGAAEEFRPDVVLLDIGLPHLNGYEACQRIREQPWGKGILLIALTGWGQEEDRRKSNAAGFDAHMVKPVDHSALMELLASLPPARAGEPMGSA